MATAPQIGPKFAFRCVQRFLDRRSVAHVAGHRPDPVRTELVGKTFARCFQFFRAARGDREPGALVQARLDNAEPDAAAAAGDEDDLVLQLQIHVVLRSVHNPSTAFARMFRCTSFVPA